MRVNSSGVNSCSILAFGIYESIYGLKDSSPNVSFAYSNNLIFSNSDKFQIGFTSFPNSKSCFEICVLTNSNACFLDSGSEIGFGSNPWMNFLACLLNSLLLIVEFLELISLTRSYSYLVEQVKRIPFVMSWGRSMSEIWILNLWSFSIPEFPQLKMIVDNEWMRDRSKAESFVSSIWWINPKASELIRDVQREWERQINISSYGSWTISSIGIEASEFSIILS